jgi:hypothetical protein
VEVVSEPANGSPTQSGPNAHIKHVGEDNLMWRFPGFRIESTRSWGLISADVVSRAAGEATWLSDRHRLMYALTNIPTTMRRDGTAAAEYELHREKTLGFRPAGQMTSHDTREPVYTNIAGARYLS